MYDELVKRMRKCATEAGACKTCELDSNPSCTDVLMEQAADAIEELVGFVQEAERDRDEYRERLDKANDVIEELQATICNWCAVCPEDKRNLSTCEIYESCRAEPPKEE